MLIKISWIVNLDPSYIVKQRNKSTSLPLGVAITTLLAGAATLPFYPIVGTYLVTGSAIFAVAAIVRFLWASYMRNQIKERKERQLLQSEKKCSKELNQLTTIELRIRELIFQESVKEFEIKKLLAGANSLYHIVQNDHPLLGKASFDRINNYVSDKGLLQGILKSSSVEKIRQHSENAIREFFSTEFVYFESMQRLTKKDWALKDESMGNFFEKLEEEGLITKKEKQGIEEDLLAIENALRDFFANLGWNEEESQEEFFKRFDVLDYPTKVRLYLIHFSPENLHQHFKSMGEFVKKYETYQVILDRVFESENGAKLQNQFFDNNHRQGINSIFIKPVQRIALYQLMWKNFGERFEDLKTKSLIAGRHKRFVDAVFEVHQKAKKIWKNRKSEERVSIWTK